MSAIPVYRESLAADRPQVRARIGSSKAKSIASIVAMRSVVFCAIAGVSYICSCLVGHVMIEKANGEAYRSADRARYARRQERLLRAEIDSATNLGSLESWGRLNGLRAPDQLVASSTTQDVAAPH